MTDALVLAGWLADGDRVIRATPNAALRRRVSLGCTTAAACGYGTGAGVSAAETAVGGMHGFPAVLTSFIGRAGPVRDVAGLLEEHRLVTVTGPGGAGKTRLADQVARAVTGRFADGAWLAELGAWPSTGSSARRTIPGWCFSSARGCSRYSGTRPARPGTR